MRAPALVLAFGLTAVGLNATERQALAAWPDNPLFNLPLCTAVDDQSAAEIVPDGAGGAIAVWSDHRSGTNYDIFAQHVLASGAVDPAWPVNGRALCTAPNNNQLWPSIVPDGAGGAIVSWADNRSGTNWGIYAQHVNAAGVPQWTTDGVALCTHRSDQAGPSIVSDGAGGAIVTWDDYRGGTTSDIYSQRVNAAGVPQWTPDGVPLCTAPNSQTWPGIVPDGAGGAIVTWLDFRLAANFAADIYAQHVLASGTVDPSWPFNGRALRTAASLLLDRTSSVSDGAGGAIVAWHEGLINFSGSMDIYAQHILGSGAVDPAWPARGSAVCTAPNNQTWPGIVPDGGGGAIVAWYDTRGGSSIYAQHVLVSGAVDPAWPANGRALCTAPNDNRFTSIVSDGAGGAIVAWSDYGSDAHIFAQHVLASGAVDPAWSAAGRALCTAASGRRYPNSIADGGGGAIVTWQDYRSGPADIYAQRVDASGQLGSGCGSRNEITSFTRGPGTASTDASQSVGAPDRRGTPFGYQGQLVLHFLCDIADGPGADLRVYELGHSFPPAIDENYRVEASLDGAHWSNLGDAPGDIADFDLGAAGLTSARYIRITDLPPDECVGIPNCDRTVMGADIDAVVALHTEIREVDCADGIDNDGDGFVDCADPDCRVDADGDGYPAPPCGTDCNDRNALIHPDATEICGNGVDDNCDGSADCADACTWPAAARQLDCTNPCNAPSQFCQDFEWIGGAVEDPSSRFDIVVGVDDRVPNGQAGLHAEAVRVMTAFETLPGADSFGANISWWIYRQVVRVNRGGADCITHETETEDPAFTSLRTLMASYGLDSAIFITTDDGCDKKGQRVPPGQTADGSYSWYVPERDPGHEVLALHEIGHLFGLTDEYYEPSNGCPRAHPFHTVPVPNVFSSQSDCEEARSCYNFTGDCFDFCGSGGDVRRIGDDHNNENLMRLGAGLDYGQNNGFANAYGVLGNIRVSQVATFAPETPCFEPQRAVVHREGTLATEASSTPRQTFVRLDMLDGISVQSSVEVMPDSGIAGVPGGDPTDLRLLNANGTVLRQQAVWDPAYFHVGGTVVDSTARVVAYRIPYVSGARSWQLMDTDGTIRASGSLDAALVDYCRRVNWTDADCFGPLGPVAVTSPTPPKTTRLLPAWPNPAQNRAFLRLELPHTAAVSVRIFDLTGRRVRRLTDGTWEPGIHTLEWETKDQDGRRVNPGVYFCVATIGAERFQRTIIVIR